MATHKPSRCRSTPSGTIIGALLSTLIFIFVSSIHASHSADNTERVALAPRRHQHHHHHHHSHSSGGINYRTLRTNDAKALPFNLSTSTIKGGSPAGIYGWNFIWRGDAYDRSRPLMLSIGSSETRCNDVSNPACVKENGLDHGWPERIANHSSYARTILDHANFGVLSIVSPLCYNTSRLSPLRNECGTAKDMHALKHIRPDLVLGIMKLVQQQFGFDEGKVVGSGGSMGGRGIFRLGTVRTLRAISVTGAHLETDKDAYMNSLPYVPWDSGEGCWTLSNPNVGGTKCTDKVPETMPLANKFANTPVQIYSSYGDDIANLNTQVRPTCDAINKFKTPTSGCTIHVVRSNSPLSRGPTHAQLMDSGFEEEDLNFLVRGYGGTPVSFAKRNRR
ncbi:unnamed protein product [Tilletia laevis]|uniref:Uncharacterized protein n=2 Tax=Tilletia TaxID=13289 RepID=A0A177T3Q6_9BASI|nr:hypothetical protein CF336_g8558 [Tilletia laevis]KAE8240766.1 hypothetical protein A4X03_0g8381 [Tilletia caries]CAD6972948.1 unnamed protein product [Tilletia controversa]KAE8183266.1 hypothetical protein CF335_g8376 [Tilletia laevis]CAD6884117.1 unnamed protein product [Tilletia caries]